MTYKRMSRNSRTYSPAQEHQLAFHFTLHCKDIICISLSETTINADFIVAYGSHGIIFTVMQ